MKASLVESRRKGYGSVDHHGRNPYEGVAQQAEAMRLLSYNEKKK